MCDRNNKNVICQGVTKHNCTYVGCNHCKPHTIDETCNLMNYCRVVDKEINCVRCNNGQI